MIEQVSDTERSSSIFRKEWSTYHKVLEGDFMHHSSLFERARQLLECRYQGPYSMLDLGCGDSAYLARILSASPQLASNLTRYIGVDLSAPALAISAQHMTAALPPAAAHGVSVPDTTTAGSATGPAGSCRNGCAPHCAGPSAATTAAAVEHVQSDILAYVRACPPSSFDVVLAAFSLHHLAAAEKQEVMECLGRLLKPGGCFCLVDVFLETGESRCDFLQRFKSGMEAWSTIDTLEKMRIFDHVAECDFPEQLSSFEAWKDLTAPGASLKLLCEWDGLYKSVAIELPLVESC